MVEINNFKTMQKKNGLAKGFTLLELLIVIAILAVLSTIVVLVLNPAEYLRQARDSQRLADLKALVNSINLYLSSVPNPSLGTGGSVRCTGAASPNGVVCNVASGTSAIDGTGWVSVNLASMTGGSPLARLPIDPVNLTSSTYAYEVTTTAPYLTYEIEATMESQKYGRNGNNDVVSKDGGVNPNVYEIGSDLNILK